MTDYPKHVPAFSYVGRHRYFLTFCTHRREARFEEAATVSDTWSHFLRAAAGEEIEIIAYCFMADHVHLVVEGKAEDSDLKRFIARAKVLRIWVLPGTQRSAVVAAVRVRARA